jgi:hypothetical protein
VDGQEPDDDLTRVSGVIICVKNLVLGLSQPWVARDLCTLHPRNAAGIARFVQRLRESFHGTVPLSGRCVANFHTWRFFVSRKMRTELFVIRTPEKVFP